MLRAPTTGAAWVQAVVPLRFSRGDATYLLLGPRDGARRYLSEDFAVLMRLGAAVVEHVEQLRGIQMQGLVSQAELKALQAQINPHFLFNSLNTLYGTIDRGNAEARRLVLNLADVFRYLLRSDRTLIEIEEELRIVRAYLEIEQLRLGAKLRTEINVDEAALRATIPLLSVQPLVENAVKHGVAPRTGDGLCASRHYFPAGHADGDRFQLRRMRLGRSDGGSRERRNRLGQCPPPAGAVLRRRIQFSRRSRGWRHDGRLLDRNSSMPLKTLIVDDEPIARKVLREELELIDDVEVIGEAADGTSGAGENRFRTAGPGAPRLADAGHGRPGGGAPIEAWQAPACDCHRYRVTISTRCRRSRQGAIDYLLKPVGQERLSQAVERAKRVTGRQAMERIAQLQEIGGTPLAARTRRIVGKIGEEYFLLSADEIYAFQAEGDLVWIVTAKRKYLATQTLKELESRLKNTSFRRIHRNALVNVDHVRKMSALSSQRWLITMNNDQEFVASKRQARTVRELLTW